jgi:hypothetical protein
MSCAGGVQEVCREIKGQLRRKAVGNREWHFPDISLPDFPNHWYYLLGRPPYFNDWLNMG